MIEAFEEIFASTRGKIVVTSFATSIYRLQILVNLAAQFERKVAFVGRGMVETSQIAQRLGYLKVPAGLAIRDSEVKIHPPADGAVPRDGQPGRADVGAVAHRDRRPPPRRR